MNMEDEDEYLEFYDFSKTYENHPLLNKGAQNKAIKESENEDDEEGEEWEDCDVEDMNSEEAEAEIIDHEDIEMNPGEEAKNSDTSSFAAVSNP